MEKLLASADGKKKQIITGTRMSMNTEGLRSRSFGVVLNGVIYPVIKPMESTWSLLKSASTAKNKKYFKAVVEAITAVKGKKERYEAYERVLAVEFNVAPIASEFAYEYANRKATGINMREGGDRNLYKNQKLNQYFDVDYKPTAPTIQPPPPPPPPKEEELQVFDVDDKGEATPVVDMERVRKKVVGFRMEKLEDEQSASLKRKVKKFREQRKREEQPPPPPPIQPYSERSREYDPTKYEAEGLRDKFEVIKGKAIRVSKLQRGEFGYVFRNLIFPMWKKDMVGSASNSWSMVESRMLNQEQELFRRMNKLSNPDAISLYFRFYEEIYRIPVEVLARGLELANNKFTKDLVEGINNRAERNGISTTEGYNINFQKGEGKEGIFQTLKGFFKLDIDSRKVKKVRDSLADEEFERLQYTPDELKRLFGNVDFYDAGKGSRLTDQELEENIQVERELDNPSVRVDEEGDIIPPPPPLPPAPPIVPPQPVPIPQPPVNIPQNNNVNNIQMNNTEEGANVGDRQKALDEAKKDEATQPMTDNIPDLSQHGFQIAIQNVFIKYNKDFTFIKNLVEQNPALRPSEADNKQKIDLCYAMYSSLFPLPANDGNYSYGKALELETLKFQYRRNVELENAWKRNLGNLSSNGQGGGANMGIIVNTQGLGMSASQLFNQQPPANAPPAPPQAPLNNAPPAPPATAQVPQPQGVAQEPLKTKTPDIQQEYKPQPEAPQPKGKKTGKKTMKQRSVVLNVREKKLNPNLLFTKLNSKNPLPEPVGDMPSFRIRSNNKKRIRL